MSKKNEKNGVIVPYDIFTELMVDLYCQQEDFLRSAKTEAARGTKYTPRFYMAMGKKIFLLRARLGNCRLGRVEEKGVSAKAWVSTAREDI